MFTKLEQHSWIKIEVTRHRSMQECFQGMLQACAWQCKESHRCCCHGPLEPLAMKSCGTSTVKTRYKSMRLRSLSQSERTTARDPVQHQRWTYPCYGAINTEHQQRLGLSIRPDFPWHVLFSMVKNFVRADFLNLEICPGFGQMIVYHYSL